MPSIIGGYHGAWVSPREEFPPRQAEWTGEEWPPDSATELSVSLLDGVFAAKVGGKWVYPTLEQQWKEQGRVRGLTVAATPASYAPPSAPPDRAPSE